MGLCSIIIDDVQLAKIHGYAMKTLEQALENKTEFNFEDTAKALYNAVKPKGENAAASYVQLLPQQLMLVATYNPSFFGIKGFDASVIGELMNDYTNDINNVNSLFKGEGLTKEEIELQKKLAEEKKKKGENPVPNANVINTTQQEELKTKIEEQAKLDDNVELTAHKKSSAWGTTGQQGVTNNKGRITNVPDQRVQHIYDFLNVLQEAGLNQGGDFDNLELGGHTGFRLTPIKKSTIDKNTIHQRDKDLLAGKEYGINESKGQNYFNAAIEFFITDLDGNILYFDDTNQVVEKEEGAPIYYPMPSVKKSGNKYELTNKADKDKLMTPTELAKFDNKDTWVDATEEYREELIKEAEVKQQRELKTLYDLKSKVEKNPTGKMPLKISGTSTGVASILNQALKPLSNVNWKASKLDKAQTVIIASRTNETRKEKSGWGYLRLPGITSSVKLERTPRTKEQATELADLLLDDLTYDGKPIENSLRIKLFENQVYTQGNDIGLLSESGNLIITLRRKKLNLKDKVAAKSAIVDFLLEPSGSTPAKRAETLKKFEAGTYPEMFRNFHAYNNLPLDLTSEFLGFEIADGKVITQELDPLEYVIENTRIAIGLNSENAIPILNGYVKFEITEDDLTVKNKNLEQEKKELEKEIAEVEKEIAEIEKAGVDKKGKTETKKLFKQLSMNFGSAVDTIVKDEITEEEIAQAAAEENISEEEVRKQIVEQVDNATQEGKFDRAKKSDSFIKKLARKVFRVVRNLIIAGVMYTGITAANFSEGTYNFNNVIENTAELMDANEYTSEYSETFILAASKLGIYDVSTNESTIDLEAVKEAQKVKELKIKKDALAAEKEASFRQYKEDNTYYEKIDVVKDSHYKARKGSKDNLLSARNQWFNEDGFTYISGSIQSKIADGEIISEAEGVAHFMILDDLGVDLSAKTSDKELVDASNSFKKHRIGKDIAMTDYVPVFDRGSKNKKIAEDIKKQEYAEAQRLIDEAHPLEKKAAESLANLQREAADKKFNKVVAKENKKVTVNYKVATELDSNDITITRLHQYKFSDIDFESKTSARPFGFHGGGVYALTNKAGVGLPNFLFTSSGKSAYSRFSGGSYVLIFKDKHGNEIVHEVSGSLDLLKKEGNDLAKSFGISTSDITLGIYDAGSYSAKPAADAQGNIETNQYRNYNKIHPHSGGALIYPKAPVDPMDAAGLLFLSPLGLVRRKRKNKEDITNKDLTDLKNYRDQLQEKLDSINEALAKQAESKEEVSSNIKDSNPAEIDPGFTTDINDAFSQILEKSKGKKLPFRFEKLSPTHRAKAKKAEKWYASHPMSKMFPVEMAMHVANSNAYATWSKNGITLFKGSSKTDIYHEAWHGFSQFFLTPEEKQSLYDELANTEVGHKALKKFARKQKVAVDSISQATKNLVMEEYLAEDFRKYKLNGGKKVLGSPIRNTIFRRILNFLKDFFGIGTIQPTMDINTVGKVKELYEALNLMDGQSLINYSPSELNMMPDFNKLNKGVIVPLDKISEDSIAYADVNLVMESIDSIMASVIDQKVVELGPHIAAALYNQPEVILPALYQKTKELFVQKLIDVETKLKTETDLGKIKDLDNQKKILNFTIKNFGEPQNWVEAMTKETDAGIVAYHLKKSQFLSYIPKSLDRDILEEIAESTEGVLETTWQKSSTKFSMTELASNQIKTLLFAAKKYDDRGQVEKNSLGFEKLLDFNIAFKTIITLTKDLDDPSDMQIALYAASKNPNNKWIEANVLNKLGPVATYNRNSMNLWTNFWQTFYKATIPLQQLTIQEVIETVESGQNVRTVTAHFGRAEGAFKQVKFAFSNNFKTTRDRFIKPDENGANVLNVSGLIKEYKGETGTRKIEFLRDLGLPISDNKLIIEGINKNVNTDMMYDKLVNYDKNLALPITDVISILTNPHVIKTEDRFGKIATKKTVKGEATNMKHIYDLEYKYSGKYGNDAAVTAEGTRQFEDVQNSSLTRQVQAFNKAKSFSDLVEMPYMSHLNPARNSFTFNGSVWLNSIFEMDKEGKPKREGVSLELNNISGTVLIRNENADYDFSSSSSKADKFTRLMQDMYGLLMSGKPSTMTPADKGTILSISMSDIIIKNDPSKVSKHLYVDTADFLESSSGELSVGGNKVRNLLVNYIQSEIDRIHRIEANNEVNVKGVTTDILNADGTIKSKARGKTFQVFDGMFSEDVKAKFLALDMPLKEYLREDTGQSNLLAKQIDEQLAGFMESEVESIRERMGSLLYFDSTIMSNLDNMLRAKKISIGGITKDELIAYKRDLKVGKITQDEYKKLVGKLKANERNRKEEALIKSYAMNLFIHNIESLGNIYGDLSQYQDFFKRNPGVQSDGYQFRNDAIAQDYINETMFNPTGEHFKQTYANKMFPELTRRWDGVLNTAVVRDTVVSSYLVPEYKAAFIKHFTKVYSKNKNLTKKEAAAKALESTNEALEPYLNMEEGDGQGWLTFDAYKMLSELQGKWSPEQDKLYNDIIAGKTLTLQEVTKYFPARKYQYYGALKTEGVPLMAFHKYSLMPLVPNVIDGKNMEVFHNNLVKQNMDYAVHESGSKVATIYPEGATEASQLWESVEDRVLLEDAVYENNPIFIEFLKDQLDINDNFKGKNIFPTQFRKLIEEGSMENGLPTDFIPEDSLEDRLEAWENLSPAAKKKASPKWANLNEYEKNIYKHIEVKKDEILESVGSSLAELRAGKGNLEIIAEFIKNELDRQDMGLHELAMVELDPTGKEFKYDLSISPSAEKIERVLTSYINNMLVRVKVNGEPLVQLATTMMESRNATPEEKEKWGNSDLQGYRQEFDKDGNAIKTIGADAKIALQGDFIKLLQLKGLDGEKIGVTDENGNYLETESLDRLNALINNEVWRSNSDNLKMITIVGVRIPVQGLNNTEFFHIKEFLPKAAGNAIIPPSEIVAKSGADFDIDKLTMMMPRIIINKGVVKALRAKNSKKSRTTLTNEIDALKLERKEKAKKYREEIKTLVDGLSKEVNKDINKSFYPTINALSNKLDKASYDYELAREANKKKPTYHNVKEVNRTEKNRNRLENEIEELESQMYNAKSFIRDVVNLTPELQALTEKRNEVLTEISDKIDDLKEAKESMSSKALENELMFNLNAIQEDPDNFISLIMPIDAGIVKTKALAMEEIFKSNGVGYNAEKGWKKKPGGTAEITKGKVSPTKTLTAVHNNHIHESNSVGKETLGLGAVDNTFNILLNRIGAHMNPYYGFKNKPADISVVDYKYSLENMLFQAEKVLDKEKVSDKDETQAMQIKAYAEKELNNLKNIRILLPHNTMNYKDNNVVSLSHMYDVNNEHKISNLISQLMNGWVDVAKGAWVFNVQGNKIISPTLLYMIQAGVPFDTVVDFLSNPLIIEYVDKQLSLTSPIAALDPANESISPSTSKTKTLAKEHILLKYGKNFLPKDMKGDYMLDTNAVYNTSVILVDENNKDKIFSEKNLAKIASGKASADDNFKAFMHFIEIEEQGKGLGKVKLTINYDTSKTDSLFDAALSQAKYNDLLAETMLPSEVISRLVTDTPVGAFKIQDFITDVWGSRFKLRNNKVLNDFLIKKYSDFTDKGVMKSLFGTEEKYTNQFRNDLVVYGFLEYFNEFDINNIKGYKGLEVSVDKADIEDVSLLNRGVAVKKSAEGTKIYLDKAALKEQFRLQSYSADRVSDKLSKFERYKALNIYGVNALGVAPVEEAAFISASGPNASEYYRFVMERELLRANNPMEEVLNIKSVSDAFDAALEDVGLFPYESYTEVQEGEEVEIQETDKARNARLLRGVYENWLKDTALRNNLNLYSLFRGKDTVAQTLKEIKKTHPHLEKVYSLLQELIVEEGSGYKNFKLRKTKLEGDEINGLHENFLELANPDVMKIPGETPQAIAENKRISEFFTNLPIYGFLQAGLSVTDRLSITRIMPFEKLTSFLEESSAETIKKLNGKKGKEYLDQFYTAFNEKNSNRKLRRDKNYRLDQELTTPVESRGLESLDTNSFTVNIESAGQFETLVKSNPDVMFVVEKGSLLDTKVYVEGVGQMTPTKNMLTLTTRQFATDSERSYLPSDKQQENSEVIEAELDKIYDLWLNNEVKIAFVNSGYGDYMLNASKTGGYVGNVTYNKMSTSMFEKFGFTNKNAKFFPSIATEIGAGQVVTDQAIEESINNELEETLAQIDKCK